MTAINIHTACFLILVMGKTTISSSGQCSSSEVQLYKVAEMPGRGVRLTLQSKYIVESVRNFFEKEWSARMSSRVIERSAVATGVSVRSVRKIHKEFISRDGEILTPLRRYAASQVRVNANSFDQEVIRHFVHSFYEQKVYPTLYAVLEKVKDECSFPGGRYCLWKLLNEMKVSYKKRDNKQFIYERGYILEQRHIPTEHT